MSAGKRRAKTVRPVTIVVPILDDPSSLELCLASIIQNVDLSVHSVVIVIDGGPRADEIESTVLGTIAGISSIHCYRNVNMLGYSGSCNRVVFELDSSDNDVLLLNSDVTLTPGALDELVEVLGAADQHGAVSPRGNDGGIASFPYFRRSFVARAVEINGEGQAGEDSRGFGAVSGLLPRWYLSPVAFDYCLLVRRSLITNYGLFDLAFGEACAAVGDFCMRINAAGFSSLIANRAFLPRVRQETSASELDPKVSTPAQEMLVKRYPFFTDALNTFISFGFSAADVFAEIVASHTHMSVLVDIRYLSHAYNGSSMYALSFLRALSRATLPDNVSVTVAAPTEAIAFFDLPRYGLHLVPYQQLSGVFDVGIALAPVNNVSQLIHLNDHCARWVVTHFDLIQARAWQLTLRDPMLPVIVEQGLAHADRIITLSEFSLDDAEAYYPALAEGLSERAESVHLGSTRDAACGHLGVALGSDLPSRVASIVGGGSYLVVLGNSFPHKQVALAARALESLDTPVIAFGPIDGLPETPARAIATSGVLSNSAMEKIIGGAALVIFPSAYEGYGLPIPESLDFGVPVVAFDTVVSREVVDGLGGRDAVRFFTRFDELAAVVSEALEDEDLHRAAAAMKAKVRGLDTFANRLLEITLEQLSEPLDLARLAARYDSIKKMERLVSMRLDVYEHMWREMRDSESFKIGHRIVKMLGPIARLLRRRP